MVKRPRASWRPESRVAVVNVLYGDAVPMMVSNRVENAHRSGVATG